MVLTKTRHNSLVQDVVNQIEQAIVDGVFKPGEKIESVREMQNMLGISSGTLREAIRILQQKGLIEVKLGTKGGVFVRESTTAPLSEGLALLIRQRRISIDELAEFRQVVEAGLLELVAKKLQSADLKRLKQFLAELEFHSARGANGWKGFLEVEVQLRKVLIQIAKNHVYETVLVPIHENIFAYAYLLPGKQARVQEAYQDWCEIVAALENRNAEKAARIMQDHIRRYARRISKFRAIKVLKQQNKSQNPS